MRLVTLIKLNYRTLFTFFFCLVPIRFTESGSKITTAFKESVNIDLKNVLLPCKETSGIKELPYTFLGSVKHTNANSAFSIKGGHYTAILKHFDRFYYLNDSRVIINLISKRN